MSNPPDRPWSEEEKVYSQCPCQFLANPHIQYTLLTEILKKAGIPSSYLVRMINELRISPSWGDIPLPQGITSIPQSKHYSIHGR